MRPFSSLASMCFALGLSATTAVGQPSQNAPTEETPARPPTTETTTPTPKPTPDPTANQAAPDSTTPDRPMGEQESAEPSSPEAADPKAEPVGRAPDQGHRAHRDTPRNPGEARRRERAASKRDRRNRRHWPLVAHEPRLTVGLGLVIRGYRDDDYGLFSDDNSTAGPEVFVSLDVLEPVPRWLLAAEVGYGYEGDSANGLVGGILDTTLDTHHVHAGANLRFKLLSFLQPHVRLIGGISYAESRIDHRRSGLRANADDTSLFLRAGLGVTLRSKPGHLGAGPFDRRGQGSLSLGVRIEGGYTMAQVMRVDLEQDNPPAEAVATRDADLGGFRRSGAYLQLSLIGAI